MSTIYQKIAAKTLAKKMDQDVVNASSGNTQDLTSQAMGAASSAMYKPAVAKNKGHDGDDKEHTHSEGSTQVYDNANDGTNTGTATVVTEGDTTIPGAKVEKIETNNDKYLKSFESGFAKDNEGFDNIEDYRLNKEGKYKPKVIKGKVNASFVPNTESNPGESTTVSNTESTAEKPMLYNNDAYSVRTNQKGIDIADKKQIRKLNKLEKKRDGKTFFGLFNKKSETKDSAKNRAIDAQIASVEAGGVPTEARNNIFKTGLFNRGTGGKSQPGTPGTSETKSTTTSTPPTSGLVDYNAGDETSGTYDAATGSFTVNEGKSNTIKENKASSSMDASTANFKPSKISNNKSFKMNGMKFKG